MNLSKNKLNKKRRIQIEKKKGSVKITNLSAFLYE